MLVVEESRPRAASRSPAVSLPFSTNLPRLFSIVVRARSSIGCETSTRRTENPCCANTWALPLPIVPAPITPTALIIDLAVYQPRTTRKRKTVLRLKPFHSQGDAVAAAETERRDAALQVSVLQRVEQRR